MSVKIKINWDNENVVSESVRIYRADSAFTSINLPPLLTEIFGDVYEYEDLTTIEGQTYFYMLSAKLGDQEIFTECFEIIASEISVPIILSIDSEQLLKSSLALRSTFYSKDGDYIYLHNSSIATKVQFLKHKTLTPFGDYETTSTAIDLIPSLANTYVYASFFGNGFGLCVITGATSAYKRYIFELSEAYAIETALLKSQVSVSSADRAMIVGNHYIVAAVGAISISQISGDIFGTYSITLPVVYSVPTNFTYCFDVARDGKTIVFISGNRTTEQDKKIVSLKSGIAFDYSSFEQFVVSRGTALSLTRANNTNRFIYDDFMLLYNVDNNSLLKSFFTKL